MNISLSHTLYAKIEASGATPVMLYSFPPSTPIIPLVKAWFKQIRANGKQDSIPQHENRARRTYREGHRRVLDHWNLKESG